MALPLAQPAAQPSARPQADRRAASSSAAAADDALCLAALAAALVSAQEHDAGGALRPKDTHADDVRGAAAEQPATPAAIRDGRDGGDRVVLALTSPDRGSRMSDPN